MPSLLDIRRRIRSVKNTQQLTKALKTVSAAKLRRAQERVLSARPYASQLKSVLAHLASRIENVSHPLLETRPEQNILLLVVTADRGLCGAFNTNIIRAGQNFVKDHASRQLRLVSIGKKGRDFFRRRPTPVAAEFINIFSNLNYGHAKEISERVVEGYGNAEFDSVYIVYNEFKSVIQQRLIVEKLLPFERGELQQPESMIDYIYEQPPQQIFDRLLPRYIETQIFRALLESAASEHGARMAAMDTATRNAGEMIGMLTLNMNRVRQAAITREIIEVVSGAGAL
jgi:F-type H+-transporting ATPase subunit gamma